MKDCLFRPHPVLLRIVVLVAIASGMVLGAWALLAGQTAQAAPPAQGQGPITILGITHVCTETDGVEDPLNDTPDQATPLLAREPQTHTLDSGGPDDGGASAGTHDKDWFTFTVSAGQAFTVSTTIPGGSILTTTEIALFTSYATAVTGTDSVAADVTTSGDLGWVADSSPATQTFWVRVVNPSAADQDPSDSFCDVVYQIALRLGGSLENSEKIAVGGLGTITYTIVLSNAGEMLPSVTVTDTFPSGVNVVTVTVSPPSAESGLVSDTTGLTWTGSVTDYGSVELLINATVDKGITTSLVNTAWITANGSLIWRSSEEVTVTQQPKVYLPVLLIQLQ
jgi:uncharacterized repeat protein (TIGR01451 family)